MSDVYMQMAMVNMAQRAAFEAMESVPNHNKSGRALLRLTETNIVTGQYDVARRYIGILQQTLFYRGVVEKLNAIVKQSPEAPLPSTYAPLREAFLYTGDAFFY